MVGGNEEKEGDKEGKRVRKGDGVRREKTSATERKTCVQGKNWCAEILLIVKGLLEI